MSKRIIYALLTCLLGALVPGCTPPSLLRHAKYTGTLRSVQGQPTVAFVSDTQSPLWFEKFFLHSDDNEHATALILREISRDTTCAALFHLGDITSAASEEGEWRKFDAEARAIRQAHIPVYPAFGNHEYLFSPDEGKYNTMLRFPPLRKQWYVKRVGPLAVILLNSNFSRLAAEDNRRQQLWYERTLDSLDRDTATAAVLVGCHHPPYTNSTITNPSEDVRRRFVPPFLKSDKARLFLSGHAHAFEHFRQDGKDFLVIGGGGGLLHPLFQGEEERWHDEFPHRDRRSFFHCLRIVPRAGAMDVQVLAVTSGGDSLKNVYALEIPYAQR